MNWTRAVGLTTAEIDAQRKEFLARCGFKSLTEVDRTAGFTKVLAKLQVLQGTSLSAAREADDPTLNSARILRNQILTEIIPCLELYRGEKLAADLADIMEDKNRWWKIDRPGTGMTLMDLDDLPIFRLDKAAGKKKFVGSQLRQMQWTLSQWLNTLRNEAGHSIHEMKTLANIPCGCAKCAAMAAPRESAAELAPNPF